MHSMAAMIDTDPDCASASQAEISAEIGAIEAEYQRGGFEETQPRRVCSPSSRL